MILIILFVLVAGIAIGAGSVYLLGQRTPKVIQQRCNHPELRIVAFSWWVNPVHNIEQAKLTCVCTSCGDLVKEPVAVVKTFSDKAKTGLDEKRYFPALKAKGWLYSEESNTWLR